MENIVKTEITHLRSIFKPTKIFFYIFLKVFFLLEKVPENFYKCFIIEKKFRKVIENVYF